MEAINTGGDHDEITSFFLSCEEGDFVIHPRDVPYEFIGADRDGGRVLYSTKLNALLGHLSAVSHPVPEQIAVVGRYGLPSPLDKEWMTRLFADRAMFFLGDLDPVDLLVYSWLRRWIAPQLVLVGVSDELLDRLDIALEDVPSMACSREEIDSLPFVNKTLSDLEELIGPKCLRLLNGGRKVETEGFLQAVGTHRKDLISCLLAAE